MLYQTTIAKTPTAGPAFDWQQLYALGLAEVQSLASNIWTDYNVHDPGVTTLELLCYALTEVSYRAHYPIPDLLATPVDNPASMAKQFFTARQILPSRPLAELDYRKLMLDVPGVANAWLSSSSLTYHADTIEGTLSRTNSGLPGIAPVNIKGLQDVTIEFTAEIQAAAEAAVRASNPAAVLPADQAARRETVTGPVLAAVKAALQSNRNLCEDFVNFSEVATECFLICGELTLAPQADEAQVMAEIIYEVNQYLAPDVARYTLPQILARPNPDGSARTPDQVFDGPALVNGFIDSQELAQAGLRQNIYLSEVIEVIMEIDGVQAVKTLLINAVNTTTVLPDKWTIPVTAGMKAQLKADPMNAELPRLILYKQDMPVTPALNRVQQAYQQLTQPAASTGQTPPPTDLPMPLGNWRDPGTYYSFQNHFPAIYGLSDAGLNAAATPTQQAAIHQFKGYLLFFDQLMANGLAQLNHVRDLFSTDPAVQRTYYSQLVDSFRDYVTLYRGSFLSSDFVTAQLPVLASRLTGQSDGVSQWVWTQLSATTTQNLTNYAKHPATIPASLTASLTTDFNALTAGASIYDAQRFSKVTLSDESVDLLAQLNAGTLPDGGTGLLNRFLLEDAYPGCVVSWRMETPAVFTDRRNRFLDHLIARYAESFTDLASITNSAFPTDAASLMAVKCKFLQCYAAISRDRSLAWNQTLTAANEVWNTENVSGLEKRLAKLLGIPNDQRRNLTSPALVATPAPAPAPAPPMPPATSSGANSASPVPPAPAPPLDLSGEGMYVIEAILLRPAAPADPFLPICPDPNCTDCAEHDPYSFRLHIILPADSGRFVNMDFRRFAESVIRSEVPAHILPRICWVSDANMAIFQSAYQDWLAALAPAPVPPLPAPANPASPAPGPVSTTPAPAPAAATMPVAPAVSTAAPAPIPAAVPPDPQAVRTAALQALINALGQMHNQYPQQKLEDCGGDNHLPKFILGRTALGSMPPTPT